VRSGGVFVTIFSSSFVEDGGGGHFYDDEVSEIASEIKRLERYLDQLDPEDRENAVDYLQRLRQWRVLQIQNHHEAVYTVMYADGLSTCVCSCGLIVPGAAGGDFGELEGHRRMPEVGGARP